VSYLTVFDSRVAGIPCQIGVLNYERHAPMDPRKAHSDMEAYGYIETDYVVLDRKGRPAPWLQDKLKDDGNILNEIKERMEEEQCDY
jgi:hypothetical protein